MIRLLGFAVVLLIGLGLGPAAAEDVALRGVALVVGEAKYVRLPKLANPASDAEAIEATLLDFGFEVERAGDLRADKLLERFEAFTARAAGADVAIVYYAGHGVEVAGKNYVLATDADISSPEHIVQSLIPVDELIDRLQAKVPVTILLLDACRTSPFKAGTTITLPGTDGKVEIRAGGLAAMVRGPTAVQPASGPDTMGTVVGFSASPGQVALDGTKGKNSPYAAALVKHITASGYSFGDVMTLVAYEVWENTHQKQLPWTSSSLNRILYFGQQAQSQDEGTNAIVGERRKILLRMSTGSEARRMQLEAVAEESGLDFALLWALADRIDDSGEVLSDFEAGRLMDVVDQVENVLDEQLLPGKSKDKQLAEADGLAEQALAEGAIAQSFEFRKEQALRADALLKQYAGQQKKLASLRTELAAAYAGLGDAAVINLDLRTAGSGYRSAADQIGTFDKALSFKLRLRSARAFARVALDEGDIDAGETAIALYRDLLEEVSRKKSPQVWAEIELQLALLLNNAAWRTDDNDRRFEAHDHVALALEVYTQKKTFRPWLTAKRLEAQLTNDLVLGDRGEELRYQLLEATPRKTMPYEWARSQKDIADFFLKFGRTSKSIDSLLKAEAAYSEGLEVYTTSAYPDEWLQLTMGRLETSYYIAFKELDTDRIRKIAAEMADLVPVVRQADAVGEAWLYRQLGDLLIRVGVRLTDAKAIRLGSALYQTYNDTLTAEEAPVQYAEGYTRTGEALVLAGKIDKDVEAVKAGRDALALAADGFERYADPTNVAAARKKVKETEMLIAKMTPAGNG